MRVLLVSDYFPPILGGISTQVYSLGKALITRGHEVSVCVIAGSTHEITRDGGIMVRKIAHVGQFFPFLHSQKEEQNIAPFPDPFTIHDIRRIVSIFKPDIIHANGWVMFPLSRLKRSCSRIPVVGTLHDYGFMCPRRDLYFEARNMHLGAICSKTSVDLECLSCSQMVYGPAKALALCTFVKMFSNHIAFLDSLSAASAFVASRAQTKYGFKVRVIPNFIRPRLHLESEEKPGFSCPREVDVLFVGRLNQQKGIQVFLNALKIVLEVLPHTKAAIVGKTDPRYKIPALPGSTIFKRDADRAELDTFFAKTRITVIPSIWAEPFGIVALEAMAFRKPVIATNVGGLNEVVKDKESGLLVNPNNPRALAAAIVYLLQHPDDCERMGKTGLQRLRLFSEEAVLPRIEEFYSDAICSH